MRENQSSGYLTRSDTVSEERILKLGVEVRILKFGVEVEEELYYLCSENKGADKLTAVTAQLICVFVFA